MKAERTNHASKQVNKYVSKGVFLQINIIKTATIELTAIKEYKPSHRS